MKKLKPQKIQETIILPSGEKVKVGPDAIRSEEGLSGTEFLKKLKQAVKKGVFKFDEDIAKKD